MTNNKRRILLVEDDEFTCYMMREIIEALGVDVEIAFNGEEAVQQLSNKPEMIGLVLMDLHMPNVSGVDATRMIRDLPTTPPNEVPIVAVTADNQYHDDSVVQKLGMNGFVSKPVTPGQLLKLIDRFCAPA